MMFTQRVVAAGFGSQVLRGCRIGRAPQKFLISPRESSESNFIFFSKIVLGLSGRVFSFTYIFVRRHLVITQ